MVDQTRRREIAVKITKPEPRAKAKPQYDYHWDRILGALAALCLSIGLVCYGLYVWLAPPGSRATVEVDNVLRQEKDVRETAKQSEGVASRPTEPRSDATPEMASADRGPGASSPAVDGGSLGEKSDLAKSPDRPEPVQDAPPRQAAGEPESVTEVGGASMAVGADPASKIEVVESEDVAGTLGEEAAEAEESAGGPGEGLVVKPEPEAPEKPGEEPAEGLFRSGSASISSPAVKRFLLTGSVVGNEPIGSLGDVAMGTKGYAEISSFSDVVGMDGDILEYQWSHEGEQVLRIRVPVGAQRWRSHSTKRVYSTMKGAWRVDLRDSEGNLLASAEFVF